jgi:single-strand DNA-binding protein
MSSVNKVILIGNVGKDPEIRSMSSGDKVANLSVATSERWKDKNGEKQEKTEWHKVTVFNQNIVKVVEQYVFKGQKVYIEGQLETRKWIDQNGQERYTTEVIIKPYKGELTMLEKKSQSEAEPVYSQPVEQFAPQKPEKKNDFIEDEIPW